MEEDKGKDEKREQNEIQSETRFQLLNIESSSKTRNKTLIIIMIAVSVMILACILGIIVVDRTKRHEIPLEEPKEVQKEIIEPTLKLPVYSEDAKIRMQNIYANNDGEKVVYLTFDDGPSNNITPQILEILKNEDVKATFFVLGSRVEIYPELVKKEFEEGHYIANHGYSHVYQNIYASKEAILDEYNYTERIIKVAIGNEEYSSHLFRFPGGSEGGKYKKVKNEAKELLKANGIEFINWNALTNDAVGKPTYESIVTDFLKTSQRKR